MVAIVDDDALALQRLWHWETTAPDRVALTQPIVGGAVRDYSWREVLDRAIELNPNDAATHSAETRRYTGRGLS
jgi:hypothetical protein